MHIALSLHAWRLFVRLPAWCWVISTFYDFCSFRCVTVNTMDRLQFLSFIFAVLLSITVHFIALRLGRYNAVEIGANDFWDIMFLYFQDGNLPPCWIFKSVQFYLLRRSGESRHITVPNFVEIGPPTAKILRFLARDVIYTSRAYAAMSVSVCLCRKCIVVTVHAGKRGGVISRYASHC